MTCSARLTSSLAAVEGSKRHHAGLHEYMRQLMLGLFRKLISVVVWDRRQGTAHHRIFQPRPRKERTFFVLKEYISILNGDARRNMKKRILLAESGSFSAASIDIARNLATDQGQYQGTKVQWQPNIQPYLP